MSAHGHPWWRYLGVALVAAGVLGVVALAGESTLSQTLAAFDHLRWWWVLAAIGIEAGSMAAFARVQRRLLRVGGTKVHLSSILAVTYAGNAISVSLPLAGAEVSMAYTYRQFRRHGIDPAVATWALAVSGIFSYLGLALVLAAGSLTAGNDAAAAAGLSGSLLVLLPAAAVLGALRFPAFRSSVNRILTRVLAFVRRLTGHPKPEAAGAFERLLDRLAAMKLPKVQYAEVLALAVWNWVADCLCLAFAIRATGVHVPWQGLLLAYGVAMGAGSIGLTPGGLGVVEAALAAALVASGLGGQVALNSVLLYRLISFWLVVVAGWALLAVLSLTGRKTTPPATAVA